jgi:hypothetical protein
VNMLNAVHIFASERMPYRGAAGFLAIYGITLRLPLSHSDPLPR